jgi:alkylation response protein AidB-like acyl-CoA dehydrogenase
MIDVEEFRLAARAWLAENLDRADAVAPPPAEKTLENIVPERELQRRLFDAGYAGITLPPEYGGQGLTRAHEEAFEQETAGYRMPDFGIAGVTTAGPCLNTMLAHATPEFLARHVPRILSGAALWVQFFSEPEAGSDLAGVRTRASRDGNRWILNGSKIWSSGAHYADYGLCLARTDWEVPKHRGLTWFGVSTTAPGVSVVPIKQINGDAEFCQEFFDDVEVHDDDRVGEVDQGWGVAQTMLVFERGGGTTESMAPDATSIAPDLVALARRVGREQDPVARQLVATGYINDVAVGCVGSRIAARLASGSADAGVAAYVKLAIGTFDPIRARLTFDIAGAACLSWEGDDAQARDAAEAYLTGRRFSIAGGTNEIQRNGIGERVLGFPREPSFDSIRPFNEVIEQARNWDGKVG